MATIKSVNLLLRFLLELCALIAFEYWGLKTGQQMIVKIGLGIGSPLLMAVVWGTILTPASSMRLHEPWLLIAELVILGLAIAALVNTGQRYLAVVFGLL